MGLFEVDFRINLTWLWTLVRIGQKNLTCKQQVEGIKKYKEIGSWLTRCEQIEDTWKIESHSRDLHEWWKNILMWFEMNSKTIWHQEKMDWNGDVGGRCKDQESAQLSGMKINYDTCRPLHPWNILIRTQPWNVMKRFHDRGLFLWCLSHDQKCEFCWYSWLLDNFALR